MEPDKDKTVEPDKDKKKEAEEESTLLRKTLALAGIPTIFMGYGFVGWLLGSWLDRKYQTGGTLTGIAMLVFIAAAFREIFSMAKRLLK